MSDPEVVATFSRSDAPCRMTSIMSLDCVEVEKAATRLHEHFGWTIHSRCELKIFTCTVYSILLWAPW